MTGMPDWTSGLAYDLEIQTARVDRGTQTIHLRFRNSRAWRFTSAEAIWSWDPRYRRALGANLLRWGFNKAYLASGVHYLRRATAENLADALIGRRGKSHIYVHQYADKEGSTATVKGHVQLEEPVPDLPAFVTYPAVPKRFRDLEAIVAQIEGEPRVFLTDDGEEIDLEEAHRPNQRARLYRAVSESESGLTYEEAGILAKVPEVSRASRFTELLDTGYVEDSGIRKSTSLSDDRAIVWVASAHKDRGWDIDDLYKALASYLDWDKRNRAVRAQAELDAVRQEELYVSHWGEKED